MNISYRTTASVLALTFAALLAPSLAHAKRMGGGKSVRPASIGKPAAAPAAKPAAPAAAAGRWWGDPPRELGRELDRERPRDDTAAAAAAFWACTALPRCGGAGGACSATRQLTGRHCPPLASAR